MVNLFILLFPFLLNNFGFYGILFVAVCICRYRFNNNKGLFIFSIVLSIVISLPWVIRFFNIPFIVFLSVHLLVSFINLIYLFMSKMWRKDIVLTVMEPLLFLSLSAFIFGLTPISYVQSRLYLWLYIYISYQAFLVLVKLIFAYKLTEKSYAFSQKLKLLFQYTRFLEPSLTMNDYSIASGALHFIRPSPVRMLKNELEFARNLIVAEAKGNRKNINNLKKQNRPLDYYLKTGKNK